MENKSSLAPLVFGPFSLNFMSLEVREFKVMQPVVVRWEMLARRTLCGLIMFGMFYSTIAFGWVYKCRSESGKITYSDIPCSVKSKTEKKIPSTPATPITPQVNNNSAEPNAQSAHQANMRYIDMKVDDAINARDFRSAKLWAFTPEHWKKIKDAERASETPIERANVELKQVLQPPVVQTPQQVGGGQEIQWQQVPQSQENFLRKQQQHESPRQKQQQLQRLQLQQQELRERQLQLQQQAIIARRNELEQQAAIDRQQRRQACINQIQAAATGALALRAIEGAGTSASSMQALLAQRAAADAARCNSIQ